MDKIQGLPEFRWLTRIKMWYKLVCLVISICEKNISLCDESVNFGEWSLVTEVLSLVIQK